MAAPLAPKSEHWSVWSKRRNSPMVTVFMSVLKFRKAPWNWVEQPQNARWWLLECPSENPEDADVHSSLLQSYTAQNAAPARPAVALLCNKPPGTPAAHANWQTFVRPFRVPEIQQWVGQCAIASVPEATPPEAQSPWRTQPFLLKQWPNMARYGGNLAITLACGQMINRALRYEQALRLGADAATLDALLEHAWRAGHLALLPATEASGSARAAHGPGPQPHSSLIQRILQKFAFA